MIRVFFGRQGQTHAVFQRLGQSVPLGLGLRLSSVHKNHEVIRVADWKQHHPARSAVRATCFHCRRDAVAGPVRSQLGPMLYPPLVSLFDQTQGDIGQQRRDDAPLWRAGVRAKELLFAQSASFEELHE